MNPPSSPSLLEVIRQLLQKVEGSSYPNNDPTSIENLKAYLRGRIAELEVEEGLRPPPPETHERPPQSTEKTGGYLDPSDSVQFP